MGGGAGRVVPMEDGSLGRDRPSDPFDPADATPVPLPAPDLDPLGVPTAEPAPEKSAKPARRAREAIPREVATSPDYVEWDEPLRRRPAGDDRPVVPKPKAKPVDPPTDEVVRPMPEASESDLVVPGVLPPEPAPDPIPVPLGVQPGGAVSDLELPTPSPAPEAHFVAPLPSPVRPAGLAMPPPAIDRPVLGAGGHALHGHETEARSGAGAIHLGGHQRPITVPSVVPAAPRARQRQPDRMRPVEMAMLLALIGLVGSLAAGIWIYRDRAPDRSDLGPAQASAFEPPVGSAAEVTSTADAVLPPPEAAKSEVPGADGKVRIPVRSGLNASPLDIAKEREAAGSGP